MQTEQRILHKFIHDHTIEALFIVESLGDQEILGLLESLPVELSAKLLSQMNRYQAARSLEKMDIGIAAKLVEKISIPVAEILLRLMDETYCSSLLMKMPVQAAKALQNILAFPKNTIGAYIDPLVFTLSAELKVEQGLAKIKRDHPPILSHVFVLEADHSLVGWIELKELITHDGQKSIRSIMRTDPPKVLADMSISALLEGRLWEESFYYLPVVDSESLFLGVITKETLSKVTPTEKRFDRQAQQASSALGDLYQIGLSSLLRSASEISGKSHQK